MLHHRPIAPPPPQEGHVCFPRSLSVHFQSSHGKWKGFGGGDTHGPGEHCLPCHFSVGMTWASPPPAFRGRTQPKAASSEPSPTSSYSVRVPLFPLNNFHCQPSDVGSEDWVVHTHGSTTLGKAVGESLHFKTHFSFLIPLNLYGLFPADKDYY